MKLAIMVAVASLAATAIGCAGTREAHRDPSMARAMGDRHEGVVAEVDAGWIAVTSPERPKDPPVRFLLDETTEIRQGAETIDREAVAEGEVVRVSYESRDGQEQARTIEILQGAEADAVKARATKAKPAWPKPEQDQMRMQPRMMHMH